MAVDPLGRLARLRHLETLDPQADHQQIYRTSVLFEFPWDYRRALEFALFRTYCVPSTSRLLQATREFELRPQKRYDDTALLMATLTEHGYDSPRGMAALRQINRAHGLYDIRNTDMLYVLSTFVFEPIRWIDKYGWRALSEHERSAGYHFYAEVGRRMGIRDIPADYASFEAFNITYEREHFRYAPSNQAIGQYTVELFCSWYPAVVRPLVRRGIHAFLDEPLRTAFGFEPQPAWLGAAARGGLRLRGRLARWLPPRRRPNTSADGQWRTYPDGFEIADLGISAADPGLDPQWLNPRDRQPRS
jgi:hypothetical protein